MPSAVDKGDRSEQMWKVLKAHILRERARKKQEREAEVEEERLRKEREAREQQDVMTLGETREQISQLEMKLQKLKEEKHQLFLQLKKVLNEDDNRRRQKENNYSEILTIQPLPTALVPQQLYISPLSRNASVPQQSYKATIKRPRSPSPQPAVSSYHQAYAYKQAPAGNAGYQNSPQKDDSRRNEFVRAVLWNKPQYPSQPSSFYSVSAQDISMYYPLASITRDTGRPVYESSRPQAYHLEQKLPEHYTLRAPPSHTHVIHSASMPLSPAQPAKTGSITSGYPVRSQPQYQQSSPSSLYTQGRAIYQSPGTMNYPNRE